MDANATQSKEQLVPAGALDVETEQKFLSQFNPDLPDFGTISEDIGTHGQAVAYLTRQAREAHGEDWDARIEEARSNAVVYERAYDPCPGPEAVTANEIQDIVLAITDIETRVRMPVFLRPVETRDRPRFFWIGPAVTPELAAMTGLPIGLGMQPVMAPAVDPTGAPMTDQLGQPAMQPQMQPVPDGYQELDQVTAFAIRKAADEGSFPSEWLCILDDRLVADIYQSVFDLLWEESGIDDFIYSNVLMTNIYGFQTAWYGWDSYKKKHIVENFSIKQAYLDRTKMELDRMSFQMFDVVMDINRAKIAYPQLSQLIDEYGQLGSPKRVDSYTSFGIADEQTFQRRTITLRTAFINDQLVPMTQAEVEEKDLVFTAPDPATGQPVQHLSDAGWTHNTGQPAADNVDPQDGSLPPGQWPNTVGIRQIATLNGCGRIVQDIRCEHAVAPILLNVCIPLPSVPYGQGIPAKLKSMQRADIEMLSAMVKYALTFSNPGCGVPESVAASLAGGLKRTHIDPTETLVFPDTLIEKFGEKAVLWFKPPPMPDAVPQTMTVIKEKMSSTSGRTEALQGITPTPNASGRLVESLQAAGASKFGFQAQWTKKMVKRLATLMHYSHLWRLDISDVRKIYSCLPDAILAMAIEKARTNRWDISLDVSDGSTSAADKRLQRAVQLHGITNPSTGQPAMSLTTLQEEAMLDSEQESARFKKESQMMPVMQPQPGQPQPGGAGGRIGSNGNGNGNGAQH